MFNMAQQVIGGTAAAALIVSDHVNGSAWYQRAVANKSDEHGSTDDYTEALVAAVAADRFAEQSATEQLLSDAELDALTADIDTVDLDDEQHEFVVPFADGLGLDWPAEDDDSEPFMWAGVDMSDEQAPF